ncbi:SDR family oxidoreductase [Caenibius tardaugens]|uniref:SDR family oxidoreductase n=1 Tax=Caenibius tardaugens TaxID=169176 RepID=UPI000F5E53EF|nr:SDR family oxidoreductase [Caenibius tardaugens]AZI35537.1 SDR family oxidoreductase [Caenibius tardaugens NBRC 16725]
MTSTPFTGRTAILAGGATLIGRATAAAFVAAGANVVIADIDAEGGGKAVAELGDAARFITTDVTSDAAIDACIAAGIDTFGGIDYLVNVTTSYLDNGLETSRADWLRALDIALVGAAMFAQKLAPQLIARKGAIVNFSSVSAHRAQVGRFVYPAAKAALAQLTRSQALEFAPHGVRVNAVAPGWTWSNVMDALSGGDRGKADRVGGPFHMPGRIASAEEVAGAVLFLCSDAATFISGAELPVDGGYLAMGPKARTIP